MSEKNKTEEINHHERDEAELSRLEEQSEEKSVYYKIGRAHV